MNIELTEEQKIQILNSSDVYMVMKQILMRESKIERDFEHVYVVCLAANNIILNIELVSLGAINETILQPMQVFRIALIKGAVKQRDNPGVFSREIRHVKVKKPPIRPIRQLDSPFNFDTDTDMDNPVENQVLLNQVMDFYHQSLKQSPEGLDYLQQRGLKHPDMIDHFKLGLAKRTLCYRLPAISSQAGENPEKTPGSRNI